MMINKIHIMSSVVAMTVIIAALWYWMMPVECVSEIRRLYFGWWFNGAVEKE